MPLQPARMRIWLTSFWRRACFPLLILLGATTLPADETTGIVAVVNADPITHRTLAEETLRRYGKDTLDSMINRHLILQACKSQGIAVTSEDVRAEIQRTATKFRLTMESYLALLQEERDISPNEYSTEIVWPMLALRALVADEIDVTDEEFNQAFTAEYGEAVKCRLIMVSARDKANSLHAQVTAAPETFGNVAKQFSEDETSASMSGLIPPIRRYTGDNELEQAAFALADGEVSPVLEVGDQWIILQSVRRLPATQPAPQAMPVVREQIKDRIRDRKVRIAAADLFADLQNQSQVVKVLGDEELTAQHPGVAAIVNGQQVSIADVANECVKRHGSEVLKGEINRKLLNQALRVSGTTVTDEDIKSEIAMAAISYGHVNGDGSANIDAWIEAVTSEGSTTRDIYVRDAVWPSVALKKLVAAEVVVTNEDLQEGFESAFGPRVEVLAVVLTDQKSAQKVWQMARDNPGDQFFGQLAAQYSVEPVSASNFGKVPPIRKAGGQPTLEREAFAMKPGELSGVIATGNKYIILRCQGFTEPIVRDIEAVRDELTRDVRERKTTLAMSKRFDELMESAEIDNFFDAQKEMPRVTEAPAAARR